MKNETNSKSSRTKRLGEILKVFGRYGLADWFARIPAGRIRDFLVSPEDQAIAEKPAAERLRLALTELGPTFIKLRHWHRSQQRAGFRTRPFLHHHAVSPVFTP